MGTEVAGSTIGIEAQALSALPIRNEAFYRALVEGMNDGVVTREATGRISFASPRMCELLGCTPGEIVGTRGERWVAASHRPAWASLLALSSSRIPQTFEIDLVRSDGRKIAAFVSRRPLFDGEGRFQGSIALVTDITARRHEASRLQEVAQATAPLTGQEFFRSVVRSLAATFGMHKVFVAECIDYPTTRVRVLAEWERGRHNQPYEFALAGTACNDTIRDGRIVCMAEELLERFPRYREEGHASYLGVPVFDASGRTVIGHIALWDSKPIREEALLGQALFRIFASRIGAELRRKRADDLLRVIAGTLAPTTGEAFFRALIECLSKTLQVRLAFIAECLDQPPTRVRTLALCESGASRDNLEYALAGLPCETVVRERRESFIADGLAQAHPAGPAAVLASYLGVPIREPQTDEVLGHLALLDDKPMPAELPSDPLIRIFTSRIAAELRRKRSDELLRLVAHATAPHTGTEFFQSLVYSLAQALHFKITFITECVDFPTTRLRALAYVDRGRPSGRFEYELGGSTCEETIREGKVCRYASGIQDRFPDARGLGVESYVGVPLFDSARGTVIGHLAFLDDQPIPEAVLEHPVLRIFASRAEAELRRKRADDTMLLIAQATAPLAGQEFFRSLLENLVRTFGFHQAFISECLDHPATGVRTLAYWDAGGFRDNTEFALEGLPCFLAIRERRPYFVPDRLAELFPAERGRARVSYLGVPLFDRRGDRVIGHLAFFDNKPRHVNVLDNPVFRILASRAGVELLRKRAEDELRESEEKYRLLIENQTDLLAKLDRGRRCTFVSPSFCEYFGKSETEVLNHTLEFEVHPQERAAFEEAYAALEMAPHRGHAEGRMLTVAGWRWLAWSYSGILDEQGRLAEIVACGRDVTERRRAEEQARQHLQHLAHVTRVSSLGEMASAIAHELNQPLTAIVSYSQAGMRLLRCGNGAVAQVTRAMDAMVQEAERASQIIRRLRTLVRREDALLAPVHLNFLIHEVLPLLHPEARQSGVDIHTELADDLPPVMADNIQIQQVLLNLVRNAIEAINAAQPERREVRIATRLAPEGNVLTCVEDTGGGIDADQAARLFEPFYSTKPDGMGIGLSISRSIIEAHGGRISATPAEGGGARFCFTLPAA